MKKELAFKSISEIIATMLVLLISLLAIFYILNYYKYEAASIDRAIQIILIAIILIVFISIMQLFILIQNPKIMVEYDDLNVYYYSRNNMFKTIPFEDIQNIYTKTSIWTKPFVVYTAIVLVTQRETFYIRHVSKMKETKEFIQNIAYHEEQK